jgi:hypothetical protein
VHVQRSNHLRSIVRHAADAERPNARDWRHVCLISSLIGQRCRIDAGLRPLYQDFSRHADCFREGRHRDGLAALATRATRPFYRVSLEAPVPPHPERVRKNYDDKPAPKEPKKAPERPPTNRGPDANPTQKKKV